MNEESTTRLPAAKTILLVEDAPATLCLCALALRHAGYDVLEARDACAAQSIARGGAKFDLVITDYLMPYMDGIELAQWFERFAPGTPIILVSARSDNASFAGSFLPNVRCFPKPEDPQDLVAIAREVLAAGSASAS